jgi:hypothetical protein
VGPEREGELLTRGARDVERVAIGELALVAVCGARQGDDPTLAPSEPKPLYLNVAFGPMVSRIRRCPRRIDAADTSIGRRCVLISSDCHAGADLRD